jgi:multidrug efflux pump subunit AcrA (membrane-fusion protein)
MVDDADTDVHRAAPPPPRRPHPPARPHTPTPPPPPTGTPPPAMDDAGAVLSLIRRVALQTDLASSLRVLGNGLAELTDCARVHCLTADPLTGTPWAAGASPDSLSGLTAHQRQQICAQPATRCRVYSPDVDDPGGTGREKILTHPIMAGDAVIAVMLAIREEEDPAFTRREGMLLATVAAQVAPLLLSAVHAALARAEQRAPDNPLFREEALERYRSQKRDGALLDLSPRWISHAYPAVLICLGAGLLYGVLGKIHQYSSGPALIRIEGTEITARAGGTVVTTYVDPGETVTAGQLLLQLHDDSESAELGEVLLEYERQLATFLFDPASESAKTSLSSIAARRQKAKQVLDARAIRAPRDGIVSDLRVREGSRLEAGDYIMTVVSADAMPTLIALLPGHDRPRLRPGMTVQFKIPGYEKTNEKAIIDEVGSEVIGPQEASRYVGNKIADALTIKGPVVIVRARLRSRTFESRDKVYTFADGMTAQAEASVRKRRVLVALIPALEKLF